MSRAESSAATTLAPRVVEVDLSAVGRHLCHTCEPDGRALCGMGVEPGPLHEWVAPVDDICPTCGKRSCPTCDLIADLDEYRRGDV